MTKLLKLTIFIVNYNHTRRAILLKASFNNNAQRSIYSCFCGKIVAENNRTGAFS